MGEVFEPGKMESLFAGKANALMRKELKILKKRLIISSFVLTVVISGLVAFVVFYVLHLQHTSQHFIETSTQIEKYQAELRNIIQRQKEEVIKKQKEGNLKVMRNTEDLSTVLNNTIESLSTTHQLLEVLQSKQLSFQDKIIEDLQLLTNRFENQSATFNHSLVDNKNNDENALNAVGNLQQAVLNHEELLSSLNNSIKELFLSGNEAFLNFTLLHVKMNSFRDEVELNYSLIHGNIIDDKKFTLSQINNVSNAVRELENQAATRDQVTKIDEQLDNLQKAVTGNFSEQKALVLNNDAKLNQTLDRTLRMLKTYSEETAPEQIQNLALNIANLEETLSANLSASFDAINAQSQNCLEKLNEFNDDFYILLTRNWTELHQESTRLNHPIEDHFNDVNATTKHKTPANQSKLIEEQQHLMQSATEHIAFTTHPELIEEEEY